MKVSKSQHDKFSFAMNHELGKLHSARCPFCKGDKFSLHEYIVDLPIFDRDEDGLVDPALKATMPALALICNNCGHIELFSSDKW